MNDELSENGQNITIIKYLKEGNHINNMIAINKFDIYRLSSNIHQLRKRGYSIITERINRGGRKFANYRLEDVNQIVH